MHERASINGSDAGRLSVERLMTRGSRASACAGAAACRLCLSRVRVGQRAAVLSNRVTNVLLDQRRIGEHRAQCLKAPFAKGVVKPVFHGHHGLAFDGKPVLC